MFVQFFFLNSIAYSGICSTVRQDYPNPVCLGSTLTDYILHVNYVHLCRNVLDKGAALETQCSRTGCWGGYFGLRGTR